MKDEDSLETVGLQLVSNLNTVGLKKKAKNLEMMAKNKLMLGYSMPEEN